jgi:RHS repeat-associated protein
VVSAFSESSPAVYRTATPYGSMLTAAGAAAWPDARTFLNDFTDPTTGLVDVAARKFDPSLGLFISVDPILNPAQPQSMTGYFYGADDPVNNSDPTGKLISGANGCEGSTCYHSTPHSTQQPTRTDQSSAQLAYLIAELFMDLLGPTPAAAPPPPLFSFGSAFTSVSEPHEGIPIFVTPEFEPVPNILDPPAPEIGIGTTTIYPLPPDFDGKFINVPAPDLGQGNETYPIPDPLPLIVYNSGKSWPQRIAEGSLWLLLIFGQHHDNQTKPTHVGNPPEMGWVYPEPPGEQLPGQSPPDPQQTEPDPDPTAQP